jgi:hypothetical protein
MSPALQQYLYDRWPEIFRERALDRTQSGMCWGIDCPDQWAPIIDALCATIVEHSTYTPHPVPSAKAVKEKAGTLRVQLGLDFQCPFCRGAAEMTRVLSERLPHPGG